MDTSQQIKVTAVDGQSYQLPFGYWPGSVSGAISLIFLPRCICFYSFIELMACDSIKRLLALHYSCTFFMICCTYVSLSSSCMVQRDLNFSCFDNAFKQIATFSFLHFTFFLYTWLLVTLHCERKLVMLRVTLFCSALLA